LLLRRWFHDRGYQGGTMKLMKSAGIVVTALFALALSAPARGGATNLVINSGGGGSLIEGHAVCSGSPGAGAALVFGGTTWCDSVYLTMYAISVTGYGAPYGMVGNADGSGKPMFAARVGSNENFREELAPGLGILVGNGAAAAATAVDESRNFYGKSQNLVPVASASLPSCTSALAGEQQVVNDNDAACSMNAAPAHSSCTVGTSCYTCQVQCAELGGASYSWVIY
jgi:hypothetical protein